MKLETFPMNNSTTTSPGPLDEPAPARATRVLLGAIGVYQRVHAGRISPCRFYPSCSDYAAEAIALHGPLRGLWLALRRVLRCRPLGPHGIDLVPEAPTPRSSPS